MARLNEKYLGHSGSTDVITFDHSVAGDGRGARNSSPPGTGNCAAIFGEIFISVGDALKQAREFGTSWESEVVRYVIHGVLHLKGYSDLEPAQRRIMKREENRLLRHVQRQFNLKELNSGRASKWTNAPSASSFEPVR
jgi:rRNA maturation RNase YbeY